MLWSEGHYFIEFLEKLYDYSNDTCGLELFKKFKKLFYKGKNRIGNNIHHFVLQL